MNFQLSVNPEQDRTTTYKRIGQLISLLVLTVVFSGCVSTTLDVPSRGEIAISADLLAEMRAKDMKASDPILIRIFKRESELEVWKSDQSGRYTLLKIFPMCRWSGKLGPKKVEGDRQAPEGIYHVGLNGLNPKSKYYLSFNLGFPNTLERAKGYTGSALMVHGACSSAGCFAISDDSISEVYALVREALRAGQKAVQVQSLPFRMTPENLAIFRNNPNYEFWLDLKEASERFEILRQAPEISFCDGRYRYGKIIEGQLSADPLSSCPKFEPLPGAVASKIASDFDEAKLIPSSVSNSEIAYIDGGMHPTYRNILNRIEGRTLLAQKTSRTLIPISKPDAALADPYTPN